MTLKRFVIRKSLIGKDITIEFVNKKGETVKYNHDNVYNTHKERFESMNCFQKYKSYTNTNCMPAFCRDMKISQCNSVTLASYSSLLIQQMSQFFKSNCEVREVAE